MVILRTTLFKHNGVVDQRSNFSGIGIFEIPNRKMKF